MLTFGAWWEMGMGEWVRVVVGRREQEMAE
jgi:hypothetical protein